MIAHSAWSIEQETWELSVKEAASGEKIVLDSGTIVEESPEIVFEVEDGGANGIIEIYVDGRTLHGVHGEEGTGLSTLIDTTNQNKWLCRAKVDWKLEPGITAWDNAHHGGQGGHANAPEVHSPEVHLNNFTNDTGFCDII